MITAAETMQRRGYMRAYEVADKLGYQRSTVTRWVTTNKVKHERVSGQLWVLLDSVREHLGPVGSTLFPATQEGS